MITDEEFGKSRFLDVLNLGEPAPCDRCGGAWRTFVQVRVGSKTFKVCVLECMPDFDSLHSLYVDRHAINRSSHAAIGRAV